MCPSGIHLYNLNQSCSSSLFKMHQLLLIEVTAMSPFTRDGKSIKNSTDEYFSLKIAQKHVFRDILQFAPKQRYIP